MRKILIATMLMSMLSSCGISDAVRYPPERWQVDNDRQQIPIPKRLTKKQMTEPQGELAEGVDVMFNYAGRVTQMAQMYALGGRQEALDTNNFDEVADSTWFTNRAGKAQIDKSAAAQIIKTLSADVPQGKLSVMGLSFKHSRPQFFVKDEKGNNYLLKLDSLSRDDFESSAELMSGFILYSLGYNVPKKIFVDNFDLNRLNLFKGDKNRSLVNEKKYAEAIDRIYKVDSSPRGVLIQLPKGKILGVTKPSGKIAKDSNDRIAHEQRRELRGLKTVASWFDERALGRDNAIDVFVSDDGKLGYVMHYILESGRAFSWVRGSGDSVAEFDAEKWQPDAIIDPYIYATPKDAFWAADIIVNVSNDALDVFSKASHFPDEKLRKKVVSGLISRKDHIAKTWLNKFAPLDNFELSNSNSKVFLNFDNLCAEFSPTENCPDTFVSKFMSMNYQKDISELAKFSSGDALDREVISRLVNGQKYVLRIFPISSDGTKFPLVDLFVLKQPSGLKLFGLSRSYHDH